MTAPFAAPQVGQPISDTAALLIDGDNMSGALAGRLIVAAGRCGPLRIKRVDGNQTGLRGWETATGFKPVFSGPGKNATDILMAIEAVDLSCRGDHSTFILASSDSDFTHLAHYLRERGHVVTRFGSETTNDSFRHACSEFRQITKVDEPEFKVVVIVEEAIQRLVRNHPNGLRIGSLNALTRNLPSFKISDQPEKTWRAYLLARPKQFAVDKPGPDARVRWSAPT